ncbi:MAG: hypothetical protein M1318_06095, partial [Firmicutes bacterium]|nr:hypothetical protein [Bacillota bacterium]
MDFRPDYRQIPALRAQCGYPPVLALTATALPAVRQDIVTLFDVDTVIQAPLDRPNLALALSHPSNSLAQQQHVHQWLDRLNPQDRVIIYADKRRDTERWAQHLQTTRGASVGVYHAGLPTAQRQAAHQAFLDRTHRILVATTAFGMGVDI